MSTKSFLFTSESVTEGHPDKVADRISDSVLDAFLKYDANSLVACETLVTTGLCVLAGEVHSQAIGKIDFQDLARSAIKEIGYEIIQLSNKNKMSESLILSTRTSIILYITLRVITGIK